jgi:hypothetical protein
MVVSLIKEVIMDIRIVKKKIEDLIYKARFNINQHKTDKNFPLSRLRTAKMQLQDAEVLVEVLETGKIPSHNKNSIWNLNDNGERKESFSEETPEDDSFLKAGTVYSWNNDPDYFV